MIDWLSVEKKKLKTNCPKCNKNKEHVAYLASGNGLRVCSVCYKRWRRENELGFKEMELAYRARHYKENAQAYRIRQATWKIKYPEKNRIQSAKWKLENPKKSKSVDLKNRYGITLQDYYKILTIQRGSCGICEGPPVGRSKEYLNVDHIHVSDFKALPQDKKKLLIRGLLCHPCNTVLGLLKERMTLLGVPFIDYLNTNHIKIQAALLSKGDTNGRPDGEPQSD